MDKNFGFEGGHVKVILENDSLVDKKLRGHMDSHLKPGWSKRALVKANEKEEAMSKQRKKERLVNGRPPRH